MRVLMDFAEDIGFMKSEMHQQYEREYDEIGKMLMALRKKWQ